MVGARRRERRKCNNSVQIANGARSSVHGWSVRSREEVEHVLSLAGEGLNQSEIARRTGVPRLTVSGWIRGKVPRCGRPAALDHRAYSYLLGMYLGDGHLTHFARALRLQIYLDSGYPGIIGECVRAIRRVMPLNRVTVYRRRPDNVVHVGCYSQRWGLLLSQHGPGVKHTRSIELEDWQKAVITIAFGWRRPDGNRRFRIFYEEIPRKNAKSAATNSG